MKTILSALFACGLMATPLLAQEKTQQPPAAADESRTVELVPTVAVLPFEGRGRNFENVNIGKSVAELLSIGLMENGVETVERAELDKALDELQLSGIGLVSKDSQLKLGQLLGAKILITGSVFNDGKKNFVVAKVIGTETSRVIGASVSGQNEPTEMVGELQKKITELLEKRSGALLPKVLTEKSVASALSATVKGAKRKVYVSVSENISVPAIDPAAQTELEKLLLELDFEVVSSRSDAEFAITGEAFAENAGTYHKFVSAAARIEMKITAVKGDKLLASGKQKERIAGVSYQVAAKDAIGQAALRLAQELLPVMK